jgi:hypothetical protein
LLGKLRIRGQELVSALTSSHLLQDQVHGYTSAFDAGFPHHDLGFGFDPRRKLHIVKLTPVRKGKGHTIM